MSKKSLKTASIIGGSYLAKIHEYSTLCIGMGMGFGTTCGYLNNISINQAPDIEGGALRTFADRYTDIGQQKEVFSNQGRHESFTPGLQGILYFEQKSFF